jgi:hypothetical protein
MKQLNRIKALSYALEYWSKPCDDGYFCSYTTSGGRAVIHDIRARLRREGKLPDPDNWKAVFIPSDSGGEQACFIRPNPRGKSLWGPPPGMSPDLLYPTPTDPPPELNGLFDVVPFHQDHGIVDCAHFVSRCLSAGEVKLYHPSVPDLVRTLRSYPMSVTRTLGVKVTREQGDQILDTGIVRPGDVIAFWAWIERERRTDYHHSTIYVGVDAAPSLDAQKLLDRGSTGKGKHRVACHTVCRFGKAYYDESWFLSDILGHFTFIHFFGPEDEIPSHIASQLKDWVAVDHGGGKEFYHFLSDGRCEKSTNAPKPGRMPHLKPDDHGYWFVRDNFAFVFWPNQGQVAKFAISDLLFGSDGTMSGTVNLFPAKAQKIGE